jgi:hypothetical protein
MARKVTPWVVFYRIYGIYSVYSIRGVLGLSTGLARLSKNVTAWARVPDLGSSMSSRLSALPILLLLLSGCLQEGPPPMGVHLFHSQRLASPGFMKVGDEVMVRFMDRRFPATSTSSAVSDLWISSFDGARQRKVVTNWSDYWGEGAENWWKPDYPAAPDPPGFVTGEHYYMVDERLAETEGGMARVAALIRLGPTMEEELRIEGVWTYTRFTVPISTLIDQPQPGQSCPGFPGLQNNCPQLIFERPALPGQKFPRLMLWNGEQELVLGPDAGSFQVQALGGTAYFILGETRTLTRLVRPINLMESLRANVSRFWVSGDERYIAVAVTDEAKSKTVVLDLKEKKEIPLAHPNPSGWSGLGADEFHYAVNATPTTPAELHRLNLLTGEDLFDTLPKEVSSLAGVLPRPQSDERLLIDSSGIGVFTGQSDWIARRVVKGPLLKPAFTRDGKYLVYIEPAAATLYDTTLQGALMFQDAELAAPATMVSPPGLLVNAQDSAGYRFLLEGDSGPMTLAFWARLGRASSDLYYADYVGAGPPSGTRKMAEAILSVGISSRSLFGIVNMSQQDAVGDLVYRDFDKGTDVLYARAVSDAAELGGSDLSTSYAAYIVRGRAESDRSGLWLTTLAPPVPPDGGP